ncbi:MAG: serine hydrolase [Bacteroidota bacterium]
MKLLKYLCSIIPLLLTLFFYNACRDVGVQQARHFNAPFRNLATEKVDSLLSDLSLHEKVGQLCLVSNKSIGPDQLRELTALIKPAGVISTHSNGRNFISNFYNLDTLGNIPMLCVNEADQIISQHADFPEPISLKAVRSDSIINFVKSWQAKKLSELGFQFDISTNLTFRQVADLNGGSAYSTNPELHFDRNQAFLVELKSRRILTGAKHLSYLPQTLPDTVNAVDSLNMYFRKAALAGCPALFVDPYLFQNFPMFPVDSLEGYLLTRLSFDGLLLTDVPESKRQSDEFFRTMLKAGIDLFILESKPETSFNTLLTIFESETSKSVDKKVQKILMAKSWVGLLDDMVMQQSSSAQISKNEERWLMHFLYEQSMTLVRDSQAYLPVKNADLGSTYLVTVGEQKPQDFINTSWKYSSPSTQHFSAEGSGSIINLNTKKLRRYGTVVIALNDFQIDTSVNSAFIDACKTLQGKTKVVVVNFKNPGNLRYFGTKTAFLQVYESNALLETLTAQVIFGGIPAHGQSPVDVFPLCSAGDGIQSSKSSRLKYTIPEDVGILPEKLKMVDTLVFEAINSNSIPGCQVLLAKEGKVFYHKSFGYHTYQKRRKVKSSDLYDLASITKVASTSVAAMQLFDKGGFKLNDSLYQHIPQSAETPIGDIKIKNLFIHESGLQANMPILPFIVYIDSTTGRYDKYFCWDDQQYFKIKIAEDFYMGDDYIDSMWTAIYDLPVEPSMGYQYSDVNFNILQYLIEASVDKPINEFVNQQIYAPLGLRKITYNPLDEFKPEQIVPTEEDEYWRMQLVHGFVHDESAALLGGVAGNAGLFSNAYDLAILFQMLLNEGTYGGQRFISKNTVELFTKPSHGNHRGLGFDCQSDKGATACSALASEATFGHTGFTGTAVWADPESDLLFVFLSNRVHPTRKNKGLYTRQIRERIHHIAYQAMGTFDMELNK